MARHLVIPWEDGAGPELPVLDEDGVAVAGLWQARLAWRCADALLRARVVADRPHRLPEAEPSEPVPGALARLLRACPPPGALLALENPAQALGVERIHYARGVRLFGIAGAGDEACWDAALSEAQVVYGVRGELRCRLEPPGPPAPLDVLAALGFGAFTAGDGLQVEELEEDPGGVRWRLPDVADPRAAVIVAGGFEAARLRGRAGAWRDTGREGYVRLVLAGGGGRCWTQPRMVMPRPGPADRRYPGASHGPD